MIGRLAESDSWDVEMADQLEIQMESSLTPREIQTRIRSGVSVTEVAAAAGVPLEKIEPYAVPVLAELEFVANQARAQHVRRGAETIATGSLGDVVAARLSARGIDPGELNWTAWKSAGRKWNIKIDYESGKAHREALFIYDQAGRFSVADNEDARWLLGLHSTSHGPQPGRRRVEEATVELNSELALVRVVQDEAQDLFFDDEADDDAYTEGALDESIDGAFDYNPRATSGIDVLYDMLSGLDEDSVKIYTGLLEANNPQAITPVIAERPKATVSTSALEQSAMAESQAGVVETETPPKSSKRKRARVPSWDEIVFGSKKND